MIENSNADEKESIEVIFIKKIKHKDGNSTYTAAMKVTPKVRSAIHVLGDKLFIYLNRCKVFDRFYVTWYPLFFKPVFQLFGSKSDDNLATF